MQGDGLLLIVAFRPRHCERQRGNPGERQNKIILFYSGLPR
jgi:hypothetical protein